MGTHLDWFDLLPLDKPVDPQRATGKVSNIARLIRDMIGGNSISDELRIVRHLVDVDVAKPERISKTFTTDFYHSVDRYPCDSMRQTR